MRKAGPALAAALALALGAAPANAGTATFTVPGAHFYTVPDNVVSLHIVATGAPGGAGMGGAQGGFGATIAADLVVRPGEQLQVDVGGPGDAGGFCCTPFYAGKSQGGVGNQSTWGGGGGGHSGVLDAYQYLIAAAGGGGGGARGTKAGGRGGDAGTPGQASCATSECGGGGGAGTTSGGGLGGVASVQAGGMYQRPDGSPGVFADGGDGGDGDPPSGFPGPAGGGGGGGGLAGGGGGGAGHAGGGGGGGGSSSSASGGTPRPDRSGVPSVTITTTTPAVRAAPSSLQFAPQRVGRASRRLVTVTNRGTGPARLDLIGLERAGRGFRASRGACPQTLQRRATCEISVTFTPRRRGAQTAVLLVGGDTASPGLRIRLTAFGGSPRLSAMRLARSMFRSGSRVALSYRADAPARTTFEVVDGRTGRRVGATFTQLATAGTNRLTFAGRGGRGRHAVALPPGRYRLRAVAHNGGGTAPPASVRFRIVG